jgi:GH35 family endo-1,4-beta-xylanase
MYNPTVKTQTKLDNSFYQNINVNDFIHKVYIECAREIWNNPYLLYHNYPPIEIKRNQRDCMNIIKDCIKEALRKLLPVKHILQVYLGEELEVDNNEIQFDKAMTDVEERNLTKIIKKEKILSFYKDMVIYMTFKRVNIR